VSEGGYWAVIPAAGVGRRMGGDIPKQYLTLAGRRVLEHTLVVFIEDRRCRGVMVAVGEQDPFWPGLPVSARPGVYHTTGGAERCHSVLNALRALAGMAGEGDWVLVHDAARPCLPRADLDRLLETLADDPVGGLLALPVRDTMKRADAGGRVGTTVDRAGLWHAMTPQMFRLGPLRAALEAALAQGLLVTDEAQAMELCGQSPRLVEGSPGNIKITHPRDLGLAERFLREESGQCG